tara:strand:+ start:1133 stop:2287 length:1155 start_codon:yes stop_codon:yes gene_type:complete
MIKCFATTNSVMIDPLGKVRPCCKFDGDFGHIDEYDSIDDILKSEHYTELRKSHTDGIFTRGCKTCENSEARGYKSRRQFYDDRYTNDDFLLDISPGTYCNLKCRMCSPYNSTKWFSDWDALREMGIINSGPTSSLNVYNMPENDVDKIINFLDTTSYEISIEFKGGEPLMNPKTQTLFEKMANCKSSNRISINLITNGTYKVDWLANIAGNFKELRIGISADGIGDVYEYIRGDKKYNWKRFLESIESYKNIPNTTLSFNYVVQNTNIHQMADFADAVAPYSVWWILLNNPQYLSTTVIPLSARADIIKKLQPLLDTTSKHREQFNTLTSIMNELTNNVDMDKEMYKQFIEYSAALDKLRNQSLLDVAPHLITEEGKRIYGSV